MINKTLAQSVSFLFFFLCVSFQLIGNVGNPIINNYSSNKIGALPQVWAIIQDAHGIFYYGTNKGVVKYDGNNWELYQTPLTSPVRSLAIDSKGTIYVGASREFGLFKANNFGKYEYVSLSDSLSNKEFGAVLKTFVIGESVYFIANHKRVFLYANSVLKEISPREPNFYRAFKIEDNIYLIGKNKGMGVINNEKFKIIDRQSVPGIVYFALPFDDDKLLVGTLKSGLYLYNLKNNNWEKFQSDIDDELIKGNAYYATQLRNGTIAISTLKRGVFIISPKGKLLYSLNKNSGLMNNSAFFLFEDKYNDLWVGQEKGVSHIELSIPFSRFGSNSGIEGSIQKTISYNGYLFCGTSSGLYAKPFLDLDKNNLQGFSNLNPDYIYNIDLTKIEVPGYPDEILLASCLRNIIWITPNIQIKELYNIYGCYAIEQSKKHKGRIFLGSSSGIDVLDLEFINNQLVVRRSTKLNGVNESIRNLHFTNDGDLWIRTAFNKVLKIEFDSIESLSNINVSNFKELNDDYEDIIVTGLESYNNKIILTSNWGILSTTIAQNESKENPFAPDYSFGTNFSLDSLRIQALGSDDYGNYWIASQKGLLMYNSLSGNLTLSRYKRMIHNKIQGINNISYFGICLISEDEIYFVDQKRSKFPSYNFNVIVNKVDIGSNYQTIFFDGKETSSVMLNNAIPANQNSVTFYYSAPFFQNSSSIKYSSMLIGFDKDWSAFGNENSRTYTNLKSKNYTFMLKAQNIYGINSEESTIDFTISTPWYWRPFIIMGYVIVIIVLVWLIVILNSARLKREKLELQELIREAITKEEEQKEQIKLQAIKLHEANKELEKLSLVASKTDNAIVIMDPHGEVEWINDGYIRMYGYTFSELLLKGTRIIGEYANIPINEMVNVWFGKREPIIFENLKLTKSGIEIWAQTTLTPVLNEKKELIYLIAIDTNITKLKSAESEVESHRCEIEAQRDMAVSQRDEIIQQKTEILDSIHYAFRIQKAIFMDETDLYSVFQNSFLYNKPRDIVSGDFLWVHQVGNIKIVAVVDCTGHGVPGAFMSLIGVSFLNNIIKEKGIVETYEILNLLRDKVIMSLGQTGEEGEAKDGMDISLLAFNTETNILSYSGANNSAYVVRNNSIIELEADKMPISIYHIKSKSFTVKQFEYLEGDMIYLFTDGYADQFGGTHEKKYKSNRFRELLVDISKLPLNQQKSTLEAEYQKWKGDLNQVDDIMVVGFKV